MESMRVGFPRSGFQSSIWMAHEKSSDLCHSKIARVIRKQYPNGGTEPTTSNSSEEITLKVTTLGLFHCVSRKKK